MAEKAGSLGAGRGFNWEITFFFGGICSMANVLRRQIHALREFGEWST